jgi:phosphatidylethanolamine N-methyltransferase
MIIQYNNLSLIQDFPAEFNGWMLFRLLLHIVSVNSLFAFTLLAFSSRILIKDDWGSVCQLVIAMTLILINIWFTYFTSDSFDDYSMYFGQFFFEVVDKTDSSLLFGINAGYSVGYFGYYGIALLSNNMSVFLLILFLHSIDLLFILFVEVPRFSKTAENLSSMFYPNPKRSSKFSVYGSTLSFLFSRSSVYNQLRSVPQR